MRLKFYFWQLNTLLDYTTDESGYGQFKFKTDTTGLTKIASYNKTIFDKNAQLTGKLFKFDTLFKLQGYDVNEVLTKLLNIYGNVEENGLILNNGENYVINAEHEFINIVDKNGKKFIELNTSDKAKAKLNDILEEIVNNWLQHYTSEIILEQLEEYETLINSYNETHFGGEKITTLDILEYYLNNTLANMNIDDLISGGDKFYKNAQTKTKRDNQGLKGGKAYVSDNSVLVDTQIKPLERQGKQLTYEYNGQTIPIRTGYRSVLVRNIRKNSNKTTAENILTKLQNALKDNKFLNEETKKLIIKHIYDRYANAKGGTAINDAQSYITIEEFIRRRYLDGTLHDYEPILLKIQNGEKLTVEEIKRLTDKVQVGKNFYFGRQWNSVTGLLEPIQIKNAEFVLIPQLIKGTELEDLYNIMKSLNIDQLDTDETSKSAYGDVIDIWNQETEELLSVDEIQEQVDNTKNAINNFYYHNLYKQQDIVDHTFEETNKAGIQILKKICDNISNENVRRYVKDFIENYIENVHSSYIEFIEDMGWKLDENGNIVNKDGSDNLNFEKLLDYFQSEQLRLGLTSNMTEYFEIDEKTGKAKMPNYLALNSSKQESILNSLITKRIARQELPGWHGTQVSGVGMGVIKENADGSLKVVKPEYHPTVYRNKNNNNIDLHEDEYLEKVKNGTIKEDEWFKTTAEYIEILVPKYNSAMFDDTKSDEEILKELEEKGLDKSIVYRMPTEGKQSVAIAKIIGFVDNSYGSTVFVSDEWVTQTGSDFDIDTIYAITYEMYRNKKVN